MTDEKLFEMIEKMHSEMQDGFKELRNEIQEVKSDIKELKTDVTDLKEGQTRIENKLDDIEANNADRHLDLGGQIDSLAKDLNVIEIVSGKNLADIAYLKSKRKRRIK